jgi:hypothetical protein
MGVPAALAKPAAERTPPKEAHVETSLSAGVRIRVDAGQLRQGEASCRESRLTRPSRDSDDRRDALAPDDVEQRERGAGRALRIASAGDLGAQPSPRTVVSMRIAQKGLESSSEFLFTSRSAGMWLDEQLRIRRVAGVEPSRVSAALGRTPPCQDIFGARSR